MPKRVSARASAEKANLRVVTSDHEEFARSVERDLAALPTIDEQDAKRRRGARRTAGEARRRLSRRRSAAQVVVFGLIGATSSMFFSSW